MRGQLLATRLFAARIPLTMSLFSKAVGNATEINAVEAQAEIGHILLDGEQVIWAAKLIRDLFVMTNMRIINVDIQGVTGKKSETISIPYRSVLTFAKETAGTIDIDGTLRVWTACHPAGVSWDFSRSVNIEAAYRTLAHYVLLTR